MAGILLIASPSTNGQGHKATDWKGERADGSSLSKGDLSKILKEHEEWLKSSKRRGQRADLRKAKLWRVDLSEANLSEANLSEAFLYQANLRKAILWDVNLSKAHLSDADLTEAVLFNANLSGANLFDADLSKAKLDKADLSKAKLTFANLRECLFELKPGSLPNIPELATAKNLSSLTFEGSPHSLIELREAFKKSGLRKQERQVTFAIEHTKRLKAWHEAESEEWYEAKREKGREGISVKWYEGIPGKIESTFKLVMFELTCKYGMSPGRPLWVLALLIPIFSIPYIFALRTNGQDGIWRVWSADRVRMELGKKKPERITASICRAMIIGFYFSILSAFHIGWRDLNVGNWIARIQPREYTLRATGWVGTISGIQSLISVYLLALWLLTYFGRPFE
jgi:uncharacterized protein YjbI with pentapeptide repeats